MKDISNFANSRCDVTLTSLMVKRISYSHYNESTLWYILFISSFLLHDRHLKTSLWNHHGCCSVANQRVISTNNYTRNEVTCWFTFGRNLSIPMWESTDNFLGILFRPLLIEIKRSIPQMQRSWWHLLVIHPNTSKVFGWQSSEAFIVASICDSWQNSHSDFIVQ